VERAVACAQTGVILFTEIVGNQRVNFMRATANDRRTSTSDSLPLTLVWVESTSDSTAAGAHLRGTIARLNDSRFSFRVITQGAERSRRLPAQLSRALRIANVVGRGLLAPRRGVFLARWSPFISLISTRWRRKGLPTVLFVQGNLDDLYDSNPWTKRVRGITDLALRSIREADEIITPSEGLAAWAATIRADGGDRITVIPNGVDLNLFHSMRDETAAKRGHALFFGNMARWQGIDTVLAALEHPAWPEDLGLWFIGDGQMAEAVRECSDPRVRYLGRLPKAEVAREAARAELVLATRHADGASATGVSPFKIIEAAAAGTPSVVTDVPGQAELARDLGGAVIIPPGDPAALAQAVADLHADAELRQRLVSVASQEVKRYDWAASAPILTRVVLRASGREPTAESSGTSFEVVSDD
jgi:glycosyltransferase involved in cell wall biosynthesis